MNKYQFANNSDSFGCISNERGVAIIAALLILMLLSFVAITSTTTVSTEKRMVRSQIVFEENYYTAESAALEGIQKLANQPDNALDELLASEVTGSSENKDLLTGVDTPDDILNDTLILDRSGGDEEITQDDLDTMLDISDLDPGTHRLVAQAAGVVGAGTADSLVSVSGAQGPGSGQTKAYISYGITTRYNGRSIVKVGYRRKVVNE
jgi:hypothetical protein